MERWNTFFSCPVLFIINSFTHCFGVSYEKRYVKSPRYILNKPYIHSHVLFWFTNTCIRQNQVCKFRSLTLYCPSGFSAFEHAHTMKRRVEDRELVFAPQQQQSPHPAVQGIAESFQQRTLVSAPAIIEAAADNMQPSTGIQYSLSHSYQVRVKVNLIKWSKSAATPT